MPSIPDKWNPVLWTKQLAAAFGNKFLAYLTVIYFLVKGIGYQALIYVQLPYFKKALKVTGERYQTYYNVASMAWSIKPLIGVVSDSFSVFGYHKRYYIVIFAVMGTGAMFSAAFLPEVESSGKPAAAFFFASMLAMAGIDLLSEGKYSELIVERGKEHPNSGSIVTWVWVWYSFGGLLAAGLVGPLSDSEDPRYVLFAFAPLFIVPVVPTLLGWLPERNKRKSSLLTEAGHPTGTPPAEGSEMVKATSSNAENGIVGQPVPHHHTGPATMQHKGITILSIICATGAVGLVLVNLLAEEIVQFVYLGVLISVVFGVSLLVLPRTAALANIFMFLKEALYFRIQGYTDYWYTSGPECVPGGPNFDYSYFQFQAKIVVSVGMLIGTFMFEKFLSKGKYRHIFWITTTIKCVASAFDIVMVERWNLSIGLPDKVAYILGDAFIDQLAIMLDFMPTVLLTAQLCPKGMESTMYALLAGFQNFGQSVSFMMGGTVAKKLGLKTTVPCNFDNLTLVILICHCLVPLAVIPLSIALIPDKNIQEKILSDKEAGRIDSDEDDRPEAATDEITHAGKASDGLESRLLENGTSKSSAPVTDGNASQQSTEVLYS